MSLAVALLVIVSAFIHALWNALLKRMRDAEDAVIGTMAVCAGGSVALAVVLRVQLPPRLSLPWCVAAGLFEAGYVITLARALTRAPLGPMYTIVRGGALVVVWPISLAFLGETLTPWRAIGTVLVVLGLTATGASERANAVAARTPASGLVYAIACAVFVGAYNLSYKVALAKGGRAEAVVALSTSIAALLNVVTAGRARRAGALVALRTQTGMIVLIGLLGTASFVIFLLTMTRAGAGIVVTLRNTSILFAQLFALALGERPRRLAVIGAGLVMLGAPMLIR
jgi:drug/metabolite transporter (DMT)-like permease